MDCLQKGAIVVYIMWETKKVRVAGLPLLPMLRWPIRVIIPTARYLINARKGYPLDCMRLSRDGRKAFRILRKAAREYYWYPHIWDTVIAIIGISREGRSLFLMCT